MNTPSLLTRRLSVAHSSSFTGAQTYEQTNQDHDALLYYHCNLGDAAAVATVLEEHASLLNINIKNGRSGSTSLFAASLKGNKTIVELLLRMDGIDVNLERNDGTTPLLIASQEGHLEVVKLLLNMEGVEINKANQGRSPLFMACYKSNANVVKLLVENNATDVNQQESEGRLTPLMIACSKGFANVVDLLLTSELIDVNLTDNSGQTAFFMACLHGHAEVVQTLSVHRDIDGSITRRVDHSSALQVACMMRYTSDIIAAVLATRGTDVNHINDDGYTALHYAEDSNVHDVVVMLSLLGGTSNRRRQKDKSDDMCQVCRVQ